MARVAQRRVRHHRRSWASSLPSCALSGIQEIFGAIGFWAQTVYPRGKSHPFVIHIGSGHNDKNVGSGVQILALLLTNVWPWPRHLTSLNLSFLDCKMVTVTTPVCRHVVWSCMKSTWPIAWLGESARLLLFLLPLTTPLSYCDPSPVSVARTSWGYLNPLLLVASRVLGRRGQSRSSDRQLTADCETGDLSVGGSCHPPKLTMQDKNTISSFSNLLWDPGCCTR